MDKLYCSECGQYCAYVKTTGIKGLFLQKGAKYKINVTCPGCVQSEQVQTHPEEGQFDINELLKQFGMI